jgi:hypothetical protein
MLFENKQFMFYFALTLSSMALLTVLLTKKNQKNEIPKLLLMYIIIVVIVYYIINWLVKSGQNEVAWLVSLVPLLLSYYSVNMICDLCSGNKLKLYGFN